MFALVMEKRIGSEFAQKVSEHKVCPYYNPTVFWVTIVINDRNQTAYGRDEVL
ncbi:MAG: hypothetical protein JETT_3422 [Candidatus Jettenia ecosi]|uniref:Uncharacterized protein n=1 Tax=Candidatus Jettenia ecosi TaxID=2494326 RepID=A0A533Q6V0_9BACT|nr:MAG: hypothetical protein JETT_3422 [Candidatus Jettenia ecosi]